MIVACIILTVFLQDISNTIKYSMFSDPSDLQEWDDHIQIVMVLKGSFKYILFWIMHPTRYLGALSKRDDLFSQNNDNSYFLIRP